MHKIHKSTALPIMVLATVFSIAHYNSLQAASSSSSSRSRTHGHLEAYKNSSCHPEECSSSGDSLVFSSEEDEKQLNEIAHKIQWNAVCGARNTIVFEDMQNTSSAISANARFENGGRETKYFDCEGQHRTHRDIGSVSGDEVEWIHIKEITDKEESAVDFMFPANASFRTILEKIEQHVMGRDLSKSARILVKQQGILLVNLSSTHHPDKIIDQDTAFHELLSRGITLSGYEFEYESVDSSGEMDSSVYEV